MVYAAGAHAPACAPSSSLLTTGDPMARLQRTAFLASIALAPVIAAASCGSSPGAHPTGVGGTAASGTGGTGGTGKASGSASGGSGGGLLFTDAAADGPLAPSSDFPSAPVVDTSAPANAPALFGPAGSGNASGGPCIFEPEPDTLYPSNWLRPRFQWNAAAGQNLFELRLHTTAQVSDLVVYTANTSWTMPKAMWTALAADSDSVPITVTVRGAVLNGTTLTGSPSVGSSQPITIAPAAAAGAIVYWTTSGGSSLKGFSAGDESVVLTLQPAQVQMPTVGGSVTCFGCHTSTPDGNYAGLTAQGPWGNVLASVEAATVGAPPPFLGAGALATLDSNSPLGIQTYSKAHWTTGDHVMVTPFGDSPSNNLAWVDLEATTSGQGTSYGFFTRTGDTGDVGAPTWSHDGKTVVYVSTNAELTGRLDNGFAKLYSVPYNARQGGTASPISGASDATFEQYYPSFSPDDAFLAFNRIPLGNQMYNQALAEVFVIPAAGGTATRLAANDPPTCSGKTSPGITNSWPKWSPQAVTASDGKTYYWLIFSSTRDPMGNPQLYITGVVVDGATVTTHGALYLWNQPSAENNHTPAWDYFMIPPPPAQ